MNSIDTAENVEVRHFMDDEHQITIGIHKDIWPVLQGVANRKSKTAGWLNGAGGDWDNMNIWIIGRLAKCPSNIEPHNWISKVVEDL